ncbi:MAG: tetratricopeptide repeat protein [Chloroflexota bacterium]|nr:tetratricopeptide repeat protein [Chloroflexota bacterium]
MSQDPGVGIAPAAETSGPSDYERQLRAEIDRQPENPRLMVSLANLLVAQGASDEAVPWYERAIEIDPNRIETRLDFAAALARRGSLSDAEVQLERALAIDDERADAHFLLGDLYAAWQPPRLDEAATRFRQAIAVGPGSVAAEQASQALARIGQDAGSPVVSPTGGVGSPRAESEP